MARPAEVLSILIPGGGWAMTGNTYEDIQFIECEPITKKQYEDGFKTADAKLAALEAEKTANRQAILDRLGLTADEAAILLG